MKQYYFLLGKDQMGPFTIEELKAQKITEHTLVWTYGMENWEQAKNFPELIQKEVPPPPPIFDRNNNEYTQDFNERGNNDIRQSFLKNKKPVFYLIIWISFHLFSLLMSYSQIGFFNDTGEPKKEEFWPFVSFTREVEIFKDNTRTNFGLNNLKKPTKVEDTIGKLHKNAFDLFMEEKSGTSLIYSPVYEFVFNGLFTEYDWSEFAFYVGAALIIYLLMYVSAQDGNKEGLQNNKHL
jgi:hypothetical protein